MPLRSIPPVQRGQFNSRSRCRTTSFKSGEPTEYKTLSVSPIRRQSPRAKIGFPSIQDVKVMKSPHEASWQFPNGEFLVMVERGEVHVEVRLGRFIDALLVKTEKED